MTNSIARQLSIDIITDEPNPIIDWFNDIWTRLFITQANVYHKNGGEFIYYIESDSSKQWFFYQDDESDIFLCDYYHYWSILETKYLLKYNDIQAITKLLVDNALNNDVSTPATSRAIISCKVDNALNNDVSTPFPVYSGFKHEVDNALNNSVATPVIAIGENAKSVANALCI